MKRVTIILGTCLLLLAMAAPAWAWSAGVTGDCAGWTITQDERQFDNWDYWTVDGEVAGDRDTTQFFVADATNETRTFTVRWVDQRPGPDRVRDTVKAKGQRACDTTTTTTTTTVPDTTTTTTTPPDTTTTTQPGVTTTTAPPQTTTTTEPPSSTTTTPPETTTTTIPVTVPCDQTDPPTCLPHTGPTDLMPLALIGSGLVALGVAVLWGEGKRRR